MDDIDLEILKILCNDGRKTFQDIAAIIGISKDKARRRFNAIKKEIPNLKASVVLDFEKIGFKTIAGFTVKSQNHSVTSEVKAKLLKCPHIGYLSEQLGDIDFYLDFYIEKIEELQEVMQYLTRIEGIESTDLWFFELNPGESIPQLGSLIPELKFEESK
jgi:Lrp/AsnC family transcriptional regulator, leucine-responsive regulatory protein